MSPMSIIARVTATAQSVSVSDSWTAQRALWATRLYSLVLLYICTELKLDDCAHT